jgi:hypothetical protein
MNVMALKSLVNHGNDTAIYENSFESEHNTNNDIDEYFKKNFKGNQS